MKGVLSIIALFSGCFANAQVKKTIFVNASVFTLPTQQEALPANTKVITLSNEGILSDADLSFGSSTFGTDQTTALQTILNTASAANPLYIIWDVKVSDTGLLVKSNTHIFALPGCGAILRDSSNDYLIGNYNYVGNNNTVGLDSNITIEGGIWNGNGIRGWRRQQKSNVLHGYMTIFQFSGLKNCTFKNITLLNSTTFAGLFCTSENILLDGVYIDQGAGSKTVDNQDGIDFVGHTKNLKYVNAKIRTGDDRCAIIPNALGGTPAGNNAQIYTGVSGDITNVELGYWEFFGEDGLGISIYIGGGNKLDGLYVHDMWGKAKQNWFLIANKDWLAGYTFDEGDEIAHNIRVENISVQVDKYRNTAENGSDGAHDPLVKLSCSVENISFKNITRTGFALAESTFQVYQKPTGATIAIVIDNLTIDGYRAVSAAPANSVNHILVVTNAYVTHFNLNNSYVGMGTAIQDQALLRNNGQIVNLQADNNRVDSIKYFINNTSCYLNNAIITNLRHTGQGASDPSITNSGCMTKVAVSGWIGNVLYANTGAGSITTHAESATIGTVGP